MTENIDKQIEELFYKVEEKRKAFKDVERKSRYKTNLSIIYEGEVVNINTVNNTSRLIEVLSFLKMKDDFFNDVKNELISDGVLLEGAESEKFKIGKFAYDDYKHDIISRIKRIQVGKQKRELEDLEDRLEAIISPEVRRKLEMEKIAKELS